MKNHAFDQEKKEKHALDQESMILEITITINQKGRKVNETL